MQASASLRSSSSSSSSSSTTPAPQAVNGQRQPQPQATDPVAAQTVTAVLPPMPFPGPYAYAPGPSASKTEDVQTHSSAPPVTSRDATPETTSSTKTTSSTSTTSTATTSTSTSAPAPDANPDKLPQLILAARRGDLPTLEALLQGSQADINQVDGKYGSTALMFAAEEGHLEVVEMLLAAGARVNDANVNDGSTALIYAAQEGHIDVVRRLVDRMDIELDQSDSAGNTPLHVAAFSNKPDVLLCLLRAGAQPNHVNAGNGPTPLMYAAEQGHIEVVKLLVGCIGIDLGQTDPAGNTALHFAAFNNRPDVVASLLGAGAPINRGNADNGSTALMDAAQRGHIDVVKLLVGCTGIDLDQTDFGGDTALHVAAFYNKADVLLCLLEAGAKINHVDAKNGGSALTLAAEAGHIDIVKLLVGRIDIDLGQTDSAGNTALDAAAFYNKPDVLLCLLKAGAQVNHVNANDGSTALILTAPKGHIDIVRLLVGWKGIELDRTNVAGNTALHVAALNNKPETLLCLLEAGALLDKANANDGATALTLAAAAGHIDVVKRLVGRMGIDLGQTNSAGDAALHLAAFNNKPEVLRCLLEAGARVNHPNAEDGSTALIFAAEEGHLDIVRLLVGWEGIELNNTTSGGYTALHVAAHSNKPEVLAILLEARADRQCVEQKGRTALAVAYDEKHAAVIEVFLEHGEQIVEVDIFAPLANPFTIVMADLLDDRKPPVIDFLVPDQPMGFFNQLTKAMQEGDSVQGMLLWLRSMGMRAAAVQQVADAFASANLAWSAQSASGKSTNAQQRLAYCFNALSSLPRLGAGDKVVLLYKAAGISAAATDRLSGIASRQLETLAALAGQAAAQLGAAMLDKLVPFCIAKIGLPYEVDSIALKRSLVDEGFCAPVAQAIALGWQAAIAALQTREMTVPAGLTMGQVMQFMRKQTELHAPAEFALAMRRQLASRDNLSHLQAMLGGGNDDGLHALFQVQCDQLLQYCEQLLEQEGAHTG